MFEARDVEAPEILPPATAASGDDGSRSEGPKQWGGDWYLPCLMIVLYIVGVCTALSHHLFYSYHHERIVDDAEWPIRTAIALAFLARACLVGSVRIAYNQWAWVCFFPPLLDLVAGLAGLVEHIEHIANRVRDFVCRKRCRTRA